MYEYLLKLLEGNKSLTVKSKKVSLEEDNAIAISHDNLIVLKYYPNNDYSVHGSICWDNNFIRSFMRLYSPFSLNRLNFNRLLQPSLMYVGFCTYKDLFTNLNVDKPDIKVISIKEGFLVRKEEGQLGAAYLTPMNQNLDFLYKVCNKMAGIILTKESGILTTPSLHSLVIWFIPQLQKFNISIGKSDADLSSYYFLEEATNNEVNEYLNLSLKDYSVPEGYEYNPLVIKYTLPLNLDNYLEQTSILADILGSY